MKVVSTEALTKLIQLVKSAFIKVDDVVEVTEIETETPSEITLAAVATSGDYNDLSNKPTIPSEVTETTVSGWGFTKNTGTVTSVNNVSPVNGNVTLSIPAAQVQADWNATSGVAQILNKPTIPTVGNGTVTLNQGGTQKGTFTLNQSGNTTINLDGLSYVAGTGIEIDTSSIPIISIDSTVVATKNELTDFVTISELNNEILPNYARNDEIPTATSDLTNDSGYITNSALTGYATETWVNNQGYISGITSSDVITALGYTPYNSTNPYGFITPNALTGYATETWVGQQGYLTAITSSDVTTALGYTPTDTDLSNLSTTGQAVIDGQWVADNLTIATNVTWKTNTAVKTYSLSSYLPNDGYSYEVLFCGVAVTGTTSGNFVAIRLNTDLMNYTTVCEARTRQSASFEAQGSVILPVGTGRWVRQYSSDSGNANGTYTLYAVGYRRIGTNS